MNPLYTLLLATAIAGIGGTALGGILSVFFKKDSTATVSLLLSFAGGIMLSMICFDLLPAAMDTDTAMWIILFSTAVGVLFVYLLNYFIDRRFNLEVPHIDESHPQTADALEELIHSDHLAVHLQQKDSTLSLLVAGIVMTCAIALHNIPEGMTIGASFVTSQGQLTGSAQVLAVLIGFHNIPEGLAVAVPLISGGISKSKAVAITACSGIPTMIGALFGYWLGEIGPLGLSLSLCLASGAMLYVVFGEIMPQSILLYRSKLPAFFVILGILIGLLVIAMQPAFPFD